MYLYFLSQVTRDVPGIDAAFLAIDTDDAVEFVWNEVRYSNRKVVKESKVQSILHVAFLATSHESFSNSRLERPLSLPADIFYLSPTQYTQ